MYSYNSKAGTLIKSLMERIEISEKIQGENSEVESQSVNREFQKIMKTDLRGRTVIILLELAVQKTENMNACFISEKLQIPYSTVLFEIKKLLMLNYIKLDVSLDCLKDNRLRFYRITSNGINFIQSLYLLLDKTVQQLFQNHI